MVGSLGLAPFAEGIFADAVQVGLGAARESKPRHGWLARRGKVERLTDPAKDVATATPLSSPLKHPADQKFLSALARNRPALTPTRENWLESGELLAEIRSAQGFEPHKLRDLHFDVLIGPYSPLAWRSAYRHQWKRL